MPVLSPDTSDVFLGRFNSFYDTLLQSVTMAYRKDGRRTVCIDILALDSISPCDDTWIVVRLLVSDAQEYVFCEECQTTAQVISHGIHLLWTDGVVGIELSGLFDQPNSLSELRQSRFYVTGLTVEWTIEDGQRL